MVRCSHERPSVIQTRNEEVSRPFQWLKKTNLNMCFSSSFPSLSEMLCRNYALSSIPLSLQRLVFWHQEVASDSFCFLINSSWLLVFILYVFSAADDDEEPLGRNCRGTLLSQLTDRFCGIVMSLLKRKQEKRNVSKRRFYENKIHIRRK